MDEATADIGMIGLAVMGQNLVLNMDDNGYEVAVYNRTASVTHEFLDGPAAGTRVSGHEDLASLIAALKRPRKVMLMVKAGAVVDAVIEELRPLLEPGDLLIDGGNSNHTDSTRRSKELREAGLLYIGTGVSGGEEGARNGPSIMPGGHVEAWPLVKDLFQAISAKVDGEPCCEWMGEDGAGHFVKMVHNGIEYGDMQLIAEAYHLLATEGGLDADATGALFERWNRGVLDSYLIDITAQIFRYKDEDGSALVGKILDSAGQKGTGKWTAIDALNLGVPLTLITEAVFARFLSALKDERVAASKVLKGPAPDETRSSNFEDDLEQALYASKIASYAQGFMLLRATAAEFGWSIDYRSVARIWRGGCIIRSRFLNDIAAAYEADADLASLLVAPFFAHALNKAQDGWRRSIARAVTGGIPVPTMSAALAFFDGYRHATLPANLIQAQRDFFGAHTYERVDKPRGEHFHTDWTGHGGKTTSGTYQA